MNVPEDGRLRVVQIACGSRFGDDGLTHTLYALTEDGRVWGLRGAEWQEKPPVPESSLYEVRSVYEDQFIAAELRIRRREAEAAGDEPGFLE